MSGTTNVGNNPRALFDRLIGDKSSAFVLKDGNVESSGKLALNSGLHWFGAKKSEDDVKSNQETMKFLLKHVSENVTDSEMQQIMNSRTRLSGDKKSYTVQERLERATYVSSELVAQLRMIAGRVRGETLRQQELQQPEVPKPQENKLEESIKKE